MTATSFMPSVNLVANLAGSFVEGVSWPVDRASLAALCDLGLSPQQIAQYFSVTPAEVSRLMECLTAAGSSAD